MEFPAFKGHFLRNQRFSVIPKLLNNTAGHTDHNNGNIRPIVAPTNCGPWRVIVVMLAPHLSMERATAIPALSLFVEGCRILPGYREKVRTMRGTPIEKRPFMCFRIIEKEILEKVKEASDIHLSKKIFT